MANTGYLDIGALQHKDGGGDTANTGYLDIGALQHQEVTTTPTGVWIGNQFLQLLGVGT